MLLANDCFFSFAGLVVFSSLFIFVWLVFSFVMLNFAIFFGFIWFSFWANNCFDGVYIGDVSDLSILWLICFWIYVFLWILDVALLGFVFFVLFVMFVVVCIIDVSNLLELVFQSALQYDVFCLCWPFWDLSMLRFVWVLKLYGVLGFNVLCLCFCVLRGALLVSISDIDCSMCVYCTYDSC